MVKMRVSTLPAKEEATTHVADSKAPATVTARQPQRFTNELDIGPENRHDRIETLFIPICEG